MLPVSVVIITKNEERNIVDCIRSARCFSHDIVVVDSGSTDHTVRLAASEGVHVVQTLWQGYGYSRNLGAQQAKYDWIFSLDADERITPALAKSLHEIDLSDPTLCFRLKRKNYFLGHPFLFGTLAFDKHYRLYNRRHTTWDLSVVHEELVSVRRKRKLVRGMLTHFAVTDINTYTAKLDSYALLCAQKYHSRGKKAGFTKRFIHASFAGTKSYIFQLGFLDGKKGYLLAKMAARYTWLKYRHLQRLNGETRSASLAMPVVNVVKASA